VIRLGPKAGAESALKLRGGCVEINSLSGHFRRMSADTRNLFDSLF